MLYLESLDEKIEQIENVLMDLYDEDFEKRWVQILEEELEHLEQCKKQQVCTVCGYRIGEKMSVYCENSHPEHLEVGLCVDCCPIDLMYYVDWRYEWADKDRLERKGNSYL